MITEKELIENINYLYKAFKKSKNRRSYTVSAIKFEENLFCNLKKIQKELKDKTYEVSDYTEFEVTSPKKRHIKACKFRDKIVQHLYCDNIMIPMLKNICIHNNFAGQKYKGVGLARETIKENIIQFELENGMNGYFYKGDIKSYYYSINHECAKDIMQYHFPKFTHWIIEKFIESTSDDENGKKGIALGNQINTIVSCLQLDGFDKFITGELGIKFYGRYADDFYLIHHDKEYLKHCIECMNMFLNTLNLELNPKSQTINFKTGITFLGMHFRMVNGKIEIKIDNSKKRAYKRKFNSMCRLYEDGKIPLKNIIVSFNSSKENAKMCTDKRFLNYYINEINGLKEKKNDNRKQLVCC